MGAWHEDGLVQAVGVSCDVSAAPPPSAPLRWIEVVGGAAAERARQAVRAARSTLYRCAAGSC